ncbi:hypothetical protein [Lysinibacillus xylanilyticus]|uniref:Phage abortive infection protein n=1 Tax=Lysinibacillus xylanilyticus TaxID=582475 RepID=A0ABT4ENV3_9BACI|nr:hypothetical protein [Lysinibacillus xylanilyticus]MCY9547301.1 hypothetical protein [Lysinibacillus xylanilyticus]
MRVLLDLLYWIFGFLVVIALSVLLYLIGYTFLVNVDISDEVATIIGGLLSLVGGFAGAMGAYMVARHQVKQEKKQEKINLLSTELPIYVGLALELNKVILNLERFESQRNSTWKFELNDNFFEGFKIRFDAIKWDRWIDTKKITDSILLNQLLFFEESFKKITEVMEYDIKKNRQTVLSLLNANHRDEAITLTKDIDWYKGEKVRYYFEMYYCLQKAIKIQTVISDKTSTIEKLIEGKFDIDDYPFFSSKDDFKIVRNDGVIDPIDITIT